MPAKGTSTERMSGMAIKIDRQDATLAVAVDGRLDTLSAPKLDALLDDAALEGVSTLVFDFGDLSYISSAGLRVMVRVGKDLREKGDVVVKDANEDVKSIFEVTGFDEFFAFE